MDLNSLKDQVSNLTLYDLKAGVRKVQNGELLSSGTRWTKLTDAIAAVMNYTEMEAKVCKRDPEAPHSCLAVIKGPRSHKQ